MEFPDSVQVKVKILYSNLGYYHGNTFVTSGSLVKNDQTQSTQLKIKTAAIFD